MVKLRVKRNDVIIHTTDIMSEEAANTWKDWQQSLNLFGKPERWVRAENEDTTQALETREVEEQIGTDEENQPVMGLITEFKLPAEYVIENVPEQEVRVETLKALGKAARIACEEAYDLISGHNLNAQLTAEQITQMTVTFAPIIQALQLKRPSVAKSLISAIEVDGVILTEQLKADVLAELAGF